MALGLISVTSLAAPPPSDLSTLRADVDEAAAELADLRSTARDELVSLRAEKAELERQVRAETTRGKTLKRLAAEAADRAEAMDEEAREWHEPTVAALAVAKAHVERTLPFARAQRFDVLEQIEKDLSAARPDHARAIERLMRFAEEESAMGSEIAYTQQSITLDGETQIVDVIRLGMALMYLRTQDGRFGWSYPASDGWRTEMIDEPALVEALTRRFEAHEANEALGPADLLVPSTPPSEAR